jgi:hypothetical protein
MAPIDMDDCQAVRRTGDVIAVANGKFSAPSGYRTDLDAPIPHDRARKSSSI